MKSRGTGASTFTKLCSVSLSILLLAMMPAQAGTITAVAHDGRVLTADVTAGDTVDMIVEFREVPLFANGPSISAVTTRAARHAALQDRFGQFAADVRRVQADAEITHTYERVFAGASLTVSRKAAAAIARLPYVAAVYPDRAVRALELERVTNATLVESVARIKADQVWRDYGSRGQGVVVAVIDTGIDYAHPALGGAFGPEARVIGGWDFVNKDGDPKDDHGHGTHVAAIIGGDGAGLTGVAPAVRFLAYKVLNSTGSGTDSEVIAGVERATDPNQDGDPSDHADIVNMSLGGGGNEDSPLVRAIETATGAGVLFVIASGNSGGFYAVSAPAIAPSALAVGATDITDVIAPFSSGGPSPTSLAIKPEVVAPGVSIVSALMGGGTISHSGTSMATPHVGGAAALLKAIHPEWRPGQIKAALVTTAESLNGDVMAQGGGRIDVLRAADTDILAEPAVVSLGRATTEKETWSSGNDIRLTNRGPVPVTLTGTMTGSSEAISIVLDPASVTIAPGETQTIRLTVAANHSLLPYPRQGSLALSGQVSLTGGKTPLHIPWAFVKSACLAITYDNDDFLAAIVTGKRSAGTRTVLRDGQRRIDVYEPPGDYDVILTVTTLGTTEAEFRKLFARRTISGDTAVEFTSSMPVTSVALAAMDDRGRALADIGRAPADVCTISPSPIRPIQTCWPVEP
jgi:subtilisin family serine protease